MLAKHPKIADPLFMCKNDSDDFPVNDGYPTETPILFINGKRRRSPETAIDFVYHVLHYRLNGIVFMHLGLSYDYGHHPEPIYPVGGANNISPLALRAANS
jgi:hypothetical protein